MSRAAYLLEAEGPVPYLVAWDLQRSLAGAVSQGAIPDTVVFLEHPPVVTLGRRADTGELHVPAGGDGSRQVMRKLPMSLRARAQPQRAEPGEPGRLVVMAGVRLRC